MRDVRHWELRVWAASIAGLATALAYGGVHDEFWSAAARVCANPPAHAARGVSMPGTLVGHEPASVETVTYAPGETRTWTADTGLHVVFVVSGSLTLSNRACRSIVYPAGEGFAAGWADYSVINRGRRPTVVLVTYMSQGTDARSGAPH